MGFYLSPLVKVNEIDLTNTVPAVATSIAAIVLRNSYKGAELKRTLVSSEADLNYMFGEPSDDTACYQDWMSAAGFLKYGNKLYVTRAMDSTATFAQSNVTYDGIESGAANLDGTALGSGSIVLSDLPDDDPDTFGTAATCAQYVDYFVMANSRGVWGNNIRYAFIDRATQYGLTLTQGMPDYIAITEGNSFKEFKSVDNRIAYNNVAEADNPLPTDPSKNFLIMIQCKDQRKAAFVTKEVFNVSTDPNALDDQGQSMYVENVVNARSNYIRIASSASADNEMFLGPQGGVPVSVVRDGWYTLTGGSDGAGADDTAVIDAYGMYANAEELDVNIIIDSNKSDTVKLATLIPLCESRMDCMSILDVPFASVYNNKGNETTSLVGWINGMTMNPNTSYASAYSNWLEVYDKYNQKYRWIPSSGYMAGIYANTDSVSDAWFAPAGLNRAVLTGVRRLAWNPTQGQRDILYSNKLNPIVSFSGQGKVVWGQKTLLSKASAFDRVNVRRLFIVLEKAISTACKYFVFEPNDPSTRNLLINMITPFLRDVKSRRGIYDFLVVADETINTPERVDRNELWVNIFIKPTRTAEFVVLNFIATKTGASFTEITNSIN